MGDPLSPHDVVVIEIRDPEQRAQLLEAGETELWARRWTVAESDEEHLLRLEAIG